MEQKRFLTTEDIAEILEIGVATVREYIRSGELPAVKLKGTYRVEREDFERFIQKRKTVKPNK